MKILKSFALGALAVASAAGLGACASKSASEKADSDSTAAVAEQAAAPVDSLAAIFADPARKSDVATDSTYAVTESGLRYIIAKQGTGKSPIAEDVVKVHYTGRLTDGTIFDSSVARGEPATFPLNRVIPGWTEGLQLMKEGGEAIFYIPANLGYGPTGAPPVIPPNADLIFEVSLISIGE